MGDEKDSLVSLLTDISVSIIGLYSWPFVLLLEINSNISIKSKILIQIHLFGDNYFPI